MKHQNLIVGRVAKMNFPRLKQLRIERNISLQEIADALGMKTAGGYKRIETGENKLKVEHLPILAEKFQMDIKDLTEYLFFADELEQSSSSA